MICLMFFLISLTFISSAPIQSETCYIQVEILNYDEFYQVRVNSFSFELLDSYIDENINVCDNLSGELLTVSIREKRLFHAGEIVFGKFSYFADEFYQGYVLDEVKVLDRPNSDLKNPTQKNEMYYILFILIILLVISSIIILRKISR